MPVIISSIMTLLQRRPPNFWIVQMSPSFARIRTSKGKRSAQTNRASSEGTSEPLWKREKSVSTPIYSLSPSLQVNIRQLVNDLIASLSRTLL